jgi:hypothetical protein
MSKRVVFTFDERSLETLTMMKVYCLRNWNG